MDIDDEDSFIKKCYKCEETVLDNLNIVYNSSNSKLILWNKYQIFVYTDTEFQSLEKIFSPEFQIHLLIASNNYILCLDCDGNVHVTSLKFKSSSHKTLNTPFQSRDHDIKICVRYQEDHLLSLKYEADAHYLCLNRINQDFTLEKKVILLCTNEHWPLEEHTKEKYILTTHSINKDNLDFLKKIFKNKEILPNSHELVVISVDKLNVYACLFSPKMTENEINLVKLYSCPAEICKIEILLNKLYLLISLTMGSIIRLSLNDISKTPDIVHLNTALYKILVSKEALIYSDGTTMWKSEHTFFDIVFTQFFIKNTHDFVKCGDHIICTTFNKLTYKFSIDDQSAYIIPKTVEYCSAEKLFSNSAYLNKLFKEIDNNNDLVMKLEMEKNYITTLALSKRPDIVNKAVQSSVTVFETFEEANTRKCTLTEEVKEYIATDPWIFLISITNSSIYDTLNTILTCLSDHTKIYITLSTAFKVLKTTCINIEEQLNTVNYLIPLNMKNETEINVNIKIVIDIPGALDNKKPSTVLYNNDVLLTSEHFIKTCHKTVNSLKKFRETSEELLEKIWLAQYGSIFKFTDISKSQESEIECTFYVKLPNDYKQIFADEHKRKWTPKTTLIMQQLSTEPFLDSKKQTILSICNESVKVKIHNDGFSNPLLTITSGNAKIALNMRNFFANMIYNEYVDMAPEKEFIGYSFYTTTENFQKSVKNCIRSSALEEFLPLMEKFEKNIIGALPL